MNSAACALAALISGVFFGFGLAISGMLDPTRVRDFLDVFGTWDPSLAFVLAGAVITAFVGVRVARQLGRPLFTPQFSWPQSRRIDSKLLVGAALFGVGWGLSGLCPGPALADLSFNGVRVATFVAAMVGGMAIHPILEKLGAFADRKG